MAQVARFFRAMIKRPLLLLAKVLHGLAQSIEIRRHDIAAGRR